MPLAQEPRRTHLTVDGPGDHTEPRSQRLWALGCPQKATLCRLEPGGGAARGLPGWWEVLKGTCILNNPSVTPEKGRVLRCGRHLSTKVHPACGHGTQEGRGLRAGIHKGPARGHPAAPTPSPVLGAPFRRDRAGPEVGISSRLRGARVPGSPSYPVQSSFWVQHETYSFQNTFSTNLQE